MCLIISVQPGWLLHGTSCWHTLLVFGPPTSYTLGTWISGVFVVAQKPPNLVEIPMLMKTQQLDAIGWRLKLPEALFELHRALMGLTFRCHVPCEIRDLQIRFLNQKKEPQVVRPQSSTEAGAHSSKPEVMNIYIYICIFINICLFMKYNM